jgi:hypothetical protein
MHRFLPVTLAAATFVASAPGLAAEFTMPTPIAVGEYRGTSAPGNKPCTVTVVEFKREGSEPLKWDREMNHWNRVTTLKVKVSQGRKDVVYALKSDSGADNVLSAYFSGKHDGQHEELIADWQWNGEIKFVTYQRAAKLLKLDRGRNQGCQSLALVKKAP